MSGDNGGKSLLTLEEVLESTGGVHVLGAGEFCFTGVQTDSRNVTAGTLFVPLLGEKQDTAGSGKRSVFRIHRHVFLGKEARFLY